MPLSPAVHALLLAFAAVLATGCEKDKDKAGSTNTSSAQPSATPTSVTQPTKAEPQVMPAATTAAAAPGKPVVTWKGVGLSTPESVLHDDLADVYLVSNIDGKPLDVDGKAFISRLSPDGTVAVLKWIDGGKNGVTLNAPKGMALTADHLYVADIDTVRMFDRKTGAPAGEVKVPGATFLNDMAVAPDGRVLVADTGKKSTTLTGMEASGTDAVYAISKDRKIVPIAKSKDLGGPSGVAVMGDKIWVAAQESGEVYSLDSKGKKADAQKLPKGKLDGIVLLGDEVLVSSWDANAIYRGKPGGEMKLVIEDVKSPADISYDKKRGRVLVPLFTESEVRAYELK